MASNRKTGTTFESELCEILSQNGFWRTIWLKTLRVSQPMLLR